MRMTTTTRTARRGILEILSIVVFLATQHRLTFGYVIVVPPTLSLPRSRTVLTATRNRQMSKWRANRQSWQPSFSANGQDDPNKSVSPSIRGRLRDATGFSLTAVRTTLRAMTGVSLTAIRASAVASTSAFVRNTMKLIVGIFPTWFRYFLQPFLIMYYVPLFMIRSLVGPTSTTREEKLAAHEAVVEHWRDAVKAAEAAQHGGYWPVHVNDDGEIVPVRSPASDADVTDVNLTDAVADSVQLALSKEDKERMKQ